MKRVLVYVVLMAFICNETAFAQSETLEGAAKEAVIQTLEDILERLDPSHYRTKKLFKEFGGDTFQVRNFIINYRSNTNNPLYGYDYEIPELLDQDTLIIMTLNTSFYVIVTESKIISERELPDHINLSSYFEYIRSSCIIHDVFLDFLNAPSNEISVVDSNNNYYLHRQWDELATLHLVINKQTRLPSMWSRIIKGHDFNLTQTDETYIDFSQDINALPTTAFSIEKYVSAGYKHNVAKPDTSASAKPAVDRTLSLEKQHVLLNYPFVLSDGDTAIIQNSTAEYIFLDFWYASCLPCLKALPELNHLAELYSDAGVEILGINCFDKGIKENLAVKMKDKNIQIPLLFGPRDLVKSLEITSFPTYYLINPDRKFELIYGGIEGVKQTIEKIFNRD